MLAKCPHCNRSVEILPSDSSHACFFCGQTFQRGEQAHAPPPPLPVARVTPLLSLDDDDRPRRIYPPKQASHVLVIRCVSAALLGVAILLFFLPWLGFYHSEFGRSKPVVTQSGLQIVMGDGTLHPALQGEKEKDRLAGKKAGEKKELDKAAPLLIFFPLLLTIALIGCIASNRAALWVAIISGVSLLILVVQFGIIGPPIERFISKGIAIDYGMATAIEFDRGSDIRYAFSFYSSIVFVSLVAIANAFVVTTQAKRRFVIDE